MSDAALLDDLSGFEFEDLMEDVFRNLGYENVRQADRTADEGRDILMEEVVDGQRRALIVECKHTATVGRPVVQKLHSAVATFDFDGPKRGMVVTTGRLTGPAQEYASDLRTTGDPYPIELIDGTDLREIADEIGLDLYNGRIEIICEETLRPVDPTSDPAGPLREAFKDITNIDAGAVPTPESHARFRPVVMITAQVRAVFETSVGVIHRINETDRFAVHARQGQPTLLDDATRRLIEDNRKRTTELDDESFERVFDDVVIDRFGQTETEYKDWAVDRLRDRHTTTVRYTGDNNVTYTKTCEPTQSDISVQSITPVYLPEIRQTVHLKEYTYPYKYRAAGPSRVTVEDGIHRCVHCATSGQNTEYTYCENCGSINCPTHIKTERLEGRPVCTGCAVTERFALKRKYFYNEDNRAEFRAQYEAMPVYEQVRENPWLVVGIVIVSFMLVLLGLSGLGLV